MACCCKLGCTTCRAYIYLDWDENSRAKDQAKHCANRRPTSPLHCFPFNILKNNRVLYTRNLFNNAASFLVAKVATLVISSTTMMYKDNFSKECLAFQLFITPTHYPHLPSPPIQFSFLSELLHMYGYYFMTRNKLITAVTTTQIDIAIFWLFGTSIIVRFFFKSVEHIFSETFSVS